MFYMCHSGLVTSVLLHSYYNDYGLLRILWHALLDCYAFYVNVTVHKTKALYVPIIRQVASEMFVFGQSSIIIGGNSYLTRNIF